MIAHHVECVDDACATVAEVLLTNAEPQIPPCPRCASPRTRHNGVRRIIFRSETAGGDVERLDAACPRCEDVETGLEVPKAEDRPALPPCAACGGPTKIIQLPPAVTWSVEPVVVYKAHDGTYRFPGATESLSTKNYDKLGYERVELKGFAAVRQFERRVNADERSRGQVRVERKHEMEQLRTSGNRSELFVKMKSMSNLGKDVARASIERTDKRPQPRSHDAGFHVSVYSDDRSSRAESRGSDGRRRRD